MSAEQEREIEQLRHALRQCVVWVESDYVRGLLTFATMHAGWKPSKEVIEYGGRVWGEARALLGIQTGADELDGKPLSNEG